MKITICGSTRFIKEMREIKEKLESLNYEVLLPQSVETNQNKEFWNNMKLTDFNKFVDLKSKRMLGHFEKIKFSDAILVLNHTKNGKKNYIGGNTFIEMGIAFEHGKKIFLLNPIPEESPYKEEIVSMKPVIINGNLKNIA